ncbi:peptidoglycan-binding protein [Janibacter sp. GXQ6167]|uniref:peptidoglycan-binding domain-containing protein n=1 Tax=Janibacter sp. GXQ6167 TaxID=3240791 RepID=UPI0035236E20
MSRTARIIGATIVPAVAVPLAAHSAVSSSGQIPRPPTNTRLPAAVDVASPYIPQTVCSPAAKPGVAAFARLMANHYSEFNYGISRHCNAGLTEHSEGRALDWMLNANDPRERAIADSVLRWLLAPGPNGEPAAMARRFGIMYIIWNRQIWGSYNMSAGWRQYTGPHPHTDHIHFSFSWDGAMQRTSWWTGVARTTVTTTPGGNPGQSQPAPPSSLAPYLTTTVRLGSSGESVSALQRTLGGVTVDGKFGPATERAVKSFQRSKELTENGIVSPNVWRALAGRPYTKTAAPKTSPLAPYLTTTVKLGSSGQAVTALQRRLGGGLAVDGKFGPATERAVKSFQRSKELTQNGIVSPNVWRALAGRKYTKTAVKAAPKPSTNPLAPYLTTTIRTGSSGNAVKALQRRLGGGLAVDGKFGPATERAVKSFQRSKELTQNGIVSPNVWRALAGQKYTKTAPKAAPKPSSTSITAYLNTTIRRGSSGNAVKALQRRLGGGLAVDGKFGPATERAVKSFQRSKELTQNGIVSPNVWRALAGQKYTKTAPKAAPKPSSTSITAYLNTTIRRGSSGNAVKALQRRLGGGLAVDGKFGPATERAVKSFQRSKELTQNGIVSPNVWRALAGQKYTKTAPKAAPKPSSTSITAYLNTTIRRGSSGNAVKALQRRLGGGLAVDGKFGPATERAVKSFQRSKELTQNGIVSPNVWRALAGQKYTKTAARAAAPKVSPGTATRVSTTTSFSAAKSQVLAKGSRGAAVKLAQQGLGGIAADGVYGSATERRVRAFQKTAGLRVTGIVDARTWDAIEKRVHPFIAYRSMVLRAGSRGDAVKAVQRALGVSADGVYGSRTEQAVRDFQGRNKLSRTGYVGGTTWVALERHVTR